jgi:hypothetical protein
MRLAAGAATAGVAYNAGQRRAQQDQYNEQAPAPAVPPAAARVDTTSELERLAKLRDSGALDDAEFTAAKQRLLGA